MSISLIDLPNIIVADGRIYYKGIGGLQLIEGLFLNPKGGYTIALAVPEGEGTDN